MTRRFRALRHWFWGEMFVRSHRSRRLTRWLYARYLLTRQAPHAD